MGKTALSEFIEYLEGIKERDNIPSYVITTGENYLIQEKEQIEKAVIFGNRQDFYDGTEEIGSNYYNSTYTQSS